jgi:hypothetical protein
VEKGDDTVHRIGNAPVAAAGLLALLCCIGGARAADNVVMLDGTVLRGRVTAQDERSVSVRTPHGLSMTIPLDRVRSITTASGTRVVKGTDAVRPAPSGRKRPPTPEAARTGGGVRAKETVELVDGLKVGCEVLFKHPNCERLVVRSPTNSMVQSLDLKLVHAVTTAAGVRIHNPKRKLTPEEKRAREINRLWGDEVTEKQIGRYARESWEKKPLIVWAHPGKSGNAMGAGTWLDEKGRPLSKSPWTVEQYVKRRKKRKRGRFDGDVLLPAADTQYKAIQPGNRDHLEPHILRHLTVERNASYNIRYTVLGNLWVKDGGDIGSGTQTGGLGSRDMNKHTFARFCGNRFPRRKRAKKGEPEQCDISHWVWIDTGEKGSMEVVGKSGGAGDRLSVKRGTLVISEDSYLGNGNRASFYSMPGTTTVLLDGAGLGCLHKIVSKGRGTYGVAGLLMFGTPEHPLTRDLRFEGCLFNMEDLTPTPRITQRTTGASFVLASTGKMVIHSRDPRKARVIFCPRPKDAPVSQYVVAPRCKGRETPTAVTAVFAGETDFDGVVFDGFYKGGIVVDRAARRRWKNVFFGESNQAASEELFRDLPSGPSR